MECWDDDAGAGDARSVRSGGMAGEAVGRVSAFASLVTPGWVQIFGGWRAFGFALCALVSAAGWWWTADTAEDAKAALALAQAQAAASQALADDYEARAEQARVDLAAANKAREAAESARARKWERIVREEPEWSSQPVPESVVEALR